MAPVLYVYSGDDVIQEPQGGSVLAAMLTGLGIDERYVRAGELVLTDLLGSTVALSNGATIQTSYAYDPYGVTTSAGAATYNTYQFTGRENDGTTDGLMYYRARYYNPAWGRFVSEDPIGIAGGVNLYGYVGGRPTTARDPTGLAPNYTPRPPPSPNINQCNRSCDDNYEHDNHICNSGLFTGVHLGWCSESANQRWHQCRDGTEMQNLLHWLQ